MGLWGGFRFDERMDELEARVLTLESELDRLFDRQAFQESLPNLRNILDSTVTLLGEVEQELQQQERIERGNDNTNEIAGLSSRASDSYGCLPAEGEIIAGLQIHCDETGRTENGVGHQEVDVKAKHPDYSSLCGEQQSFLYTMSDDVGELELSESCIAHRIRHLSQFLRNTKESGVAIAAKIAPLSKALIDLKKGASGSEKIQALLHSLLLNSTPLQSMAKGDNSVAVETMNMRRCTLRVLATALMPSNEASEALPVVLADPLLAVLPHILQCPRSVARECCTFLKIVCLRAGTNKVEALVGALVAALVEAMDKLTPLEAVNVVELVGSLVIACSQQHQTSKGLPLSEIGWCKTR